MSRNLRHNALRYFMLPLVVMGLLLGVALLRLHGIYKCRATFVFNLQVNTGWCYRLFACAQ